MLVLAMWIKSRPFIVSFYSLRGFLQNTWSVP
uniref:Uncharacterized protein n=1 Tax=Nelumbo nucifera TaxID=4432 RepID=A0A822ZBF2_NELNU|nr:TPA_asm: hypothetical protein HUJ06_016193 [Nelumbo nucifera]